MSRLALLAAAVVAIAMPLAAHAVTLTTDSPMGRLVQVVATIHTCEIPTTDAQQTAITNAGQALQDKLKASDADLDALMEKVGSTAPPGGCDVYKANFDRTLDAAIAAAR